MFVTGLVITLAATACGGSEPAATTTAAAAAATTTAPPTTTTSMAAATATTMAPTTTVAAVTTTTATSSSVAASDDDLPTELPPGIYEVGTEIRTGFWVPGECGCLWAYVDEAGTETPGPGEDAEVRPTDHAIRLDGCAWTWDG